MLNEKIDFIHELFIQNADPQRAIYAKAYLKNKFEFYGVDSPTRKRLIRTYWAKYKQGPDDSFKALQKAMWSEPKRECQYFAMDLLKKNLKSLDPSYLELMENFICTKSWWDTVDFIASNPVGAIFKRNNNLIKPYTERWMASGNMWLQRTCLIFQLKYKDDTDFDLLSRYIIELKGGKEFFINKAIGWSLRQYSKYQPDLVREFLSRNPDLSNLSKREAQKYL